MKDNKKSNVQEEIQNRPPSGLSGEEQTPLPPSDQKPHAATAKETPSDNAATNEENETSEDTVILQQPTDEGAAPNIECAIAEAEQRGYLRGRNERIEELMQRPGILERPDNGEIHSAETKADNGFLSHLKISIWDR